MRSLAILATTILAGFLFTLPGTATARTWHIHPDGSGDAPTIQAAIDSAVHHDTILLAPGTYFEAISYQGKKLTIASHFLTTQDTTYIAQTIIDGTHDWSSVVTFRNDEEPLSILCGLTIAHGHGNWQGYLYGGGIFCQQSSPTLLNLRVIDCLQGGGSEFGGGIAILGGRPLIQDCWFAGNMAHEGGGILCEGPDAHATIRNTTLTGNIANLGGGISLYGGASAVMENVIISRNTALSGYIGGSIACCSGSRTILINTTLVDNNGCGLRLLDGSEAMLANSIVWDNHLPQIVFFPTHDPCSLVVTHCDLSGGQAGIETHGNGVIEWLGGNIDAEPLFQDASGSDYRLTTDSPCIDAGTAYFEWDGQVIVDLDPEDYCGEAPDMGALEFCPATGGIPADPAPTVSRLVLRPNPFSQRTTLSFSVQEHQQVRVTVHDIQGRLVAILTQGARGPGSHAVQWDGLDVRGRRVAAGTYLVHLENEDGIRSRKIICIR